MSGAKNKIGLELFLENIGPHNGNNCIRFSSTVGSLKGIIYSPNGIGKSFISRTFRLLSPDKNGCIPEDLLTLGQTSASLLLSIVDNVTSDRKLSIKLQKGKPAEIVNDTEYLFHVFNSEYVTENVLPREYSPDGDIEGYILGKVQIDLTKDKQQAKEMSDEIDEMEKKVDFIVESALEYLRHHGVRTNLKEYRLIDKENLRNLQGIDCKKELNEIVRQLKTLQGFPDNVADIKTPAVSFEALVFDEIKRELSTSYPMSEWDDEFACEIKKKRGFIAEGLKLMGDQATCPFCEQVYSTEALALIKKYKDFLANKESQVVRKIEGLILMLQETIVKITGFLKETKQANAELYKVAKYFPSLEDTELDVPSISGMECFYELENCLRKKVECIANTDYSLDVDLIESQRIVKQIEELSRKNSTVIDRVNSIKNNSDDERLSLRRDLCNAQYMSSKAKLADSFRRIKDRQSTLEQLRESIRHKEEQVRVSKKEKVYETLEYYLNLFFSGKYSIDKDTFLIRFLDSTHTKASRILSDGEKSVVAFCLYLASTHLLITREDDYEKLFFIIDDPISSMDFNYVYAVAQSLRNLHHHFGINSYLRMLVLSHNLEFCSIIVRNHIIKKEQAFIMSPGEIERLNNHLFMPYENHLRDIISVAEEKMPPTHTIGNSIRHVLETINKFECPDKGLEKYISGIKKLTDNAYIYCLCQDLSHGNFRKQLPCDNRGYIAACNVVVDFINKRYPGQISVLEDSN